MSSINRPLLYSSLIVVTVVTFLVLLFSHDRAATGRVGDDITAGQNTPQTNLNESQSQVAPAPRQALPVRLKIPIIKVDAAIDQVGFTPEGAMGVPKGPATVAWLDVGPRPGEIGDAVIDGHFGWFHNIPAVFDNLHKLRPGDTIVVENENGSTTFIVRELRLFDLHQDTGSVFASNDGQAHLNLITCEGTWSRAMQRYSNRLVVFADKQPG